MKILLHGVLPVALIVALAASAPCQTPATPPAPANPASSPANGAKPERLDPLSPGTPAPEKPAGAADKADVNALSEAEIDQALSTIRERYVNSAIFSEAEMKRATLQGLMSRLGAGAVLQVTGGERKADGPFRSELIEDRVGYIRLGDALSAQLPELDKTLKEFGDKKITSVVLDLRALSPGTDLEGAAEVIRRFTEKGKTLFSLRRRADKEQIFTSNEDPRFRGIVVVLVDRSSAGSSEVIAASLRTSAAAMVIGQRTQGKAAEFAEVSFAGGKVLRVAVAEVALPTKDALFPGGLKPDIDVDVPPNITTAVLKQALETGVTPLITETERPRMNEAALVAGTNPELEAAILAQRNRGERGKPPLRDAVLQRALDFITTVSIYEKGTRAKK